MHCCEDTKHEKSSSSSTKSKFPKIDVHTHILPENFPDLSKRYGYGDWVRLEHHASDKAKMFKGDKFFREIEENCYRPEARLKEMDETGVSVQVLSTVPVMFSYWAKPEDTLDCAIMLNDHVAAVCNKYPTRFIGLGTLPMQAPELAVKELQRCMQIGLKGIQIASHINDLPLGDPSLFPIFQEAERLGAAVFIHPWDMAGEKLMQKYWLPWLVGMPAETSFAICSLIFSGVMEKLPNLKFCFAHGGGSFPITVGRIEHGWTCRPDLCAVDNKRNPREYCGKFWLDSLVHDPVALKVITDLMGTDKIIMGSDYPFPLGEMPPWTYPGHLLETAEGFTEEERRRMLFDNACEFLSVKPGQFLPESGDSSEEQSSELKVSEKGEEKQKTKRKREAESSSSLTTTSETTGVPKKEEAEPSHAGAKFLRLKRAKTVINPNSGDTTNDQDEDE